MLELIFNIPSVQQKISEIAYDVLFSAIELGDTDTLDILKDHPEIKSKISECEEEFLGLAAEYYHDHVTEWISQQKQNRNKP